ncbi:TPA: response regulator transcription factor [Citrobacter freundii]|uniref:LuxR C-terminal-related transcriptional regulator n=1 Tax=Citrobacter freundii TaxID=546 RepID=UPI00383A4569|nr:response regulator transcription factor [Citrobacter freundii]
MEQEKKEIIVIHDDHYFMSGMLSSLSQYEVNKVFIDGEASLNMWVENIPILKSISCAVIISIGNISLIHRVLNDIIDANLPVLIIFDNRTDIDYFSRRKNIYFANKKMTKFRFLEIIRMMISKKKVKEIHLSPRKVGIMELLMKGCTVQESADSVGISIKTASAHKTGFLDVIQAQNIQQVYGFILFLLSVWNRV